MWSLWSYLHQFTTLWGFFSLFAYEKHVRACEDYLIQAEKSKGKVIKYFEAIYIVLGYSKGHRLMYRYVLYNQ